MQLLDPTSTALDVQTRLRQRGWWSALPGLLRAGFARWPGHPDLIDALNTLVVDEGFVVAHGEALIPVCLEAAAALRRADTAPLLTHAAQLAWIFQDTDCALRILIDALSADPRDAGARAFLEELIAAADTETRWADPLETLAMRAVRGTTDRDGVIEVLTTCAPVSSCPRAWALLGR